MARMCEVAKQQEAHRRRRRGLELDFKERLAAATTDADRDGIRRAQDEEVWHLVK